jgi:hypothetical protein
MKKLFRWHRGGLEESLATMVEVQSFEDIERKIDVEWNNLIPNYFTNINTSFCGDDSERLGEDWKETYYVVADCKEGKGCAIGFCNFSK